MPGKVPLKNLNATGKTDGYVLTVQADGSVDAEAASGGANSVTQASHGFAVGEPIYYSGSAWLSAKADADSTTADAIVATVPDSGTFTYIQNGTLTLTTGQWDARSGESGGLTAGEHYLLSQATAGAITKTSPSSGILQFLLRALSTTEALVYMGAPYSAGSAAPTTVGVLSSTAVADATATGSTSLYTVPGGKVAVIVGAIVRVSEATTITAGPVAGVGVAAGEDDIVPSQAHTGMTSTADAFHLTNGGGLLQVAAAASVIKYGIDTGATGTGTPSMALVVDLIGYLVDA